MGTGPCTSWPASGGAWTVDPGETCELRFVIVPKGGKARITITVRDEEFQFDCKSGDEAVTAYFRLAVY